jgi:hypothetical protein
MIRTLFSLVLFALTVVQATAATVSAELSPTQQVAYEGAIIQIPAVILVKRGAGDSVAAAVTVNFTVGGTATQITDYLITGTATPTSITILAGQQSASLIITPEFDSGAEGQETVVIQLTTGTGYTPTAPTSVEVPIADDDVSVSLLTPKPLAYEDYTTGSGTTIDPDVNRRGVFRTTLTPARSFNTYVISELSAAGVVGAALLSTDYTVTYKIGGNGMGEGRGYTIQPRNAYLAGETQIQVAGGSANIPANAIITINTVPYTTLGGLAATSGILTITPALTDEVENGTSLTVNGVNTGFTINQANNWEPADVSTLIVDHGFGGFAPGDVFRIGTQTTPQYRVTAWDSTTGTLSFTAFTGTGGASGGLATDLSGNLEIVTHFPAVFSGVGARQMQVLVPTTSTRLEYGITPTSDTTAEGSETLTINLLTSNDFQTISPTTGQITITDDDVVVAFDPTQSVNATEGGTNGSFRVVLSSAFPRTVEIAYTVSGTALPTSDSATTDYVPLIGTVSIPAGSVTGTITVIATEHGGVEPAETVVLTLQATKDYRVVTTSGATANASAEITINDKIGVVSIETVSGQTIGRENPTSVTTAAMTVTLRSPTTGLPIATPTGLTALTVGYSIAGTASNGSDYQTLTGSVVIPAGLNQATITVTPADDTTPELSETILLTLSAGQGYTVSSTAGNASVSVADDEPIVAIGETDATEGGASGVFTVGYLPPALNRDITVDLTYSGTAVAGDFTASASSGLSTAVIIKAGEYSSTVTIAAIDDTTPEGTETVIATITPKPTIFTVGIASATMSITDNEPVLKIVKVTDTTEDSTTAGSFRISYDTASVGRAIIVNLSYPTTTATARAADLTAALPTTITIPSTTNTVTFTTLALYDGITEGPETLECKIDANASSYTVDSTSGSATMTIKDKIPTFTFAVGTIPVEGSAVYKGAFVITSNFKPLLPLTVNYTVTGDAKPGLAAGGTNDYKTLSGTVQVSELSTTIDVEAFADSVIDPLELVTVTLTNATIPVFTPGEAPLKASMEILDAIPAVISVGSAAVNNTTLTRGATAQIEIIFTQPMTVTGSPTLTLETGNNDTVATYNRISTDHYSLFFTYTVRSSDTSANMDYAGTNALALQGATILGLGNVPAVLTLVAPGTDGSLGFGQTRPINGGLDGGKPAPGTVGSGSGGCGLGSGLAGLVALCMLAGMMVSIRRVRR